MDLRCVESKGENSKSVLLEVKPNCILDAAIKEAIAFCKTKGIVATLYLGDLPYFINEYSEVDEVLKQH